MKFLAAIDQGTTSTRCVVYDRDLAVVGVGQKEHAQIRPRPGWVEHDPAELLRNTDEVVARALAAAGAGAGDIDSIGITNQRETTVFWRRSTGEPLCNAIVWQDVRTERVCEELAAQGGRDRFRSRTGLPIATYFSGPKIAWALEHVPDVRAAADAGDLACGTIDAWLVRHLTGEAATDPSNASRTMLFDLETFDWNDELLDAFALSREALPAVRASSGSRAFGVTREGSPFGAGVPVNGVLGDQQAALFGQLCFDEGEAKCTYGTGCFLLSNTGSQPRFSEHGLLTTAGWQIGDERRYALEGSVAVAGSLIQWLRDNLGFFEDSAEVEALAGSVEDSGGVVFVPAFSGLFAPRWRPDARGTIVGLTGFATRAHIARAALEATAFQTWELALAMEKDAGVRTGALRVDGGMTRNELLMQFQADVLGTAVERPADVETTAYGAALAAGLASGFVEDRDALRKRREPGRTWQPAWSGDRRAEARRTWDKAVEKSLDWA